MKGQGKSREEIPRAKIVSWGGNPGKNPPFHVFKVLRVGVECLSFLIGTGEKTAALTE